jgi:ABC-type cobalamin transport system ATPase subunit
MLERLNFMVLYVGSAAVVAFLAACLSSPQIATFTCHTSGANGAERCELAATMAAVVPEAGDKNLAPGRTESGVGGQGRRTLTASPETDIESGSFWPDL